MLKFDHLREAELRILIQAKAQTVLVISQSPERPGDNLSVAELGAEISAIACALARQNGEMN